ncbi:MAG: hypothetical protein LYZ69_05370 [Nitrososphaerales archaeon]|nr:hypothetical protein [Nitrososphaerales archaeon]
MAIAEDKPTTAFTLSLLGLVFQALGGLMVAYASAYWPSYGFFGPGMMGPWMMFGGPWMFGSYTYWFPLFVVVAAAEIALGVLGVLWMNSASLSKVRTGSTLVLVASIIAFPTMFGFMIGSLLMLVGSVLGLSWRPQAG